MPWNAADYRPDRLVVEGSNWMRDTLGLKPFQFSCAYAGEHLHMLDCRFDMVTLAAIVEPRDSGWPKVTKTSRCHICQPSKPEPPAVMPSLLDGIPECDRESNINLIALAMGVATDAELASLHWGYRSLFGGAANGELWRRAAGRRDTVKMTAAAVAQLTQVLAGVTA